MTVRTRFAPSPTGYMHIGNLRTALYEYLLAKKMNGKFILRIEDTDQERYVDGAVDIIYKSLKKAGIVHDEGPDIGGEYGPYIQSERKHIYKPYAEELIKKGKAYYCFCTKERLSSLRADMEAKSLKYNYDKKCLSLTEEEVSKNIENNLPYVIRQKTSDTGTTSYKDAVYGEISIENKEIEDQILIKADGLPTYNFANVIDDHLMKITHVIRGSEYLSSTPKYILLYNAFNWEIPSYVHLPLIKKRAGQK
jgi:glutamyl-tRNA synthetase